METIRGNTLEYWKHNAEEDYITTPISVLKYITVLEEQIDKLRTTSFCTCKDLPDGEIAISSKALQKPYGEL